MKPNTLSLFLFVLLTYFVTTLGVEAVIPAPDGCYPNFTTAEGCDALNSVTTGSGNTAIGYRSLFWILARVSTPVPAWERSPLTMGITIQH